MRTMAAAWTLLALMTATAVQVSAAPAPDSSRAPQNAILVAFDDALSTAEATLILEQNSLQIAAVRHGVFEVALEPGTDLEQALSLARSLPGARLAEPSSYSPSPDGRALHSYADIAHAISSLANAGAELIETRIAGPSTSELLESAIDDAHAQGTQIVAAPPYSSTR
ncbi:MAG: hypothetical protein HYV63_19725 [Candidatus Schekmanbacteria bacterium]|nr:hypothetical protein [Candidatus Schekmanbacteria bacterium]